MDSPQEVIKQSDLIFLCVKPHDIYSLIEKNQLLFKADQCLVSITSPIQVGWLEKMVPSSCARMIPSITNRALAGVALLTFGSKCEDDWKKKLTTLCSAFSVPMEINESIIRVSSDIVSCGPAFFSFITRNFIEAAVAETKIDTETATKLAEEMLIGLGDLLKKGFYTLPTLEEKVCVKGGITGEGIKVLEHEIGDMFEKLFQTTHKKFDSEVEQIKGKFNP